MLSIAERENKANLQNMCDVLFGTIDVCSFILIVLPLYPNMVNGYVYSVNLWAYIQRTGLNYLSYWIMYAALVLSGIIKLLLVKFRNEKYSRTMTEISMVLGIILVLFLAITREAYAVVVAFLLLVIKEILLLKYAKK